MSKGSVVMVWDRPRGDRQGTTAQSAWVAGERRRLRVAMGLGAMGGGLAGGRVGHRADQRRGGRLVGHVRVSPGGGAARADREPR